MATAEQELVVAHHRQATQLPQQEQIGAKDVHEELAALLHPNRDRVVPHLSHIGTKFRLCHAPKFKLFLHILSSCFVIASLAANFNYLAFKFLLYARNIRTVVSTAPWLLILLLCESAYFVGSMMAGIADHLLPSGTRQDLTLEENGDKPASIHGKHASLFPSVDVFLPCCKEPTDILEDSIKAALALDYPQDSFRVLVLDDGGDDDLKALCGTLQVEDGSQRLLYLRREKVPGVPHHFKCGNLNYGLKNSDAEYVVMMDADMILHPSFLKKVLPHIVGTKDVSFVQVPQSHYNLAKGDPLNDACVFSYERVLVHRDSAGAAASIGTGAIFRRSHLNMIGGFQHHSITEDTVTSFALFNLGFKSVYLTEKLQLGLAPWSLKAYINQRQRWGRGAFQQFANTYKTMLAPNSRLGFILKVCFIWHTLYYYLSIINAVLLTTMLCVLALGLPLTPEGISQDLNQQLLLYLSLFMVLWRLAWYSLWFELPISLQSRNREESQFWWMTPYFCAVVIESIFSYQKTFSFIPTSTIDQDRSAQDKDRSQLFTQLKQLKHVRSHVAFIVLTTAIVSFQVYMAVGKAKQGDCQSLGQMMGISMFLMTICAHMLVPILYILWPTTPNPAQRKSLLTYNGDGTPLFDPKRPTSTFHWPVLFYEALSLGTLAFWSITLFLSLSGRGIPTLRWCH